MSGGGAESDARGGAPAGSEAGSVAGSVAGLEAGLEVGSEAGSEVGPGPGFEVGAEVGVEVGSDADTDSGQDATATTPEAALAALRARMKTLQLATVGDDGTPHTGYTPHLFDGPDILIFVSQLAAHTRDLLARPQAAVMLIADESEARQIFARTRVSYACRATIVAPDDDAYETLLDAFQARHGKMIGLLRQLPDFVLFRLRPTSGQFVMGFGKAYRLSGDALDRFEHARSG